MFRNGHVLKMGTVMFLKWTCVDDGGRSCFRNGHVLKIGKVMF